MTTALAIPHAEADERQVAGGVVSNPRHGLGFDLVTRFDFYHPALGRVFALREALADVSFLADRIEAAAQGSGMDPDEVACLVAETNVLVGFGPFAARVAEAARARRLMRAAGEAYERLGRGEQVAEVIRLLGTAT